MHPPYIAIRAVGIPVHAALCVQLWLLICCHALQTLKRRTKDGQELEQPLHAHDIADAVAKQMRIRLVPEMVDLEGESLGVAGEYQLPLKLELASGARAALSCSVVST